MRSHRQIQKDQFLQRRAINREIAYNLRRAKREAKDAMVVKKEVNKFDSNNRGVTRPIPNTTMHQGNLTTSGDNNGDVIQKGKLVDVAGHPEKKNESKIGETQYRPVHYSSVNDKVDACIHQDSGQWGILASVSQYGSYPCTQHGDVPETTSTPGNPDRRFGMGEDTKSRQQHGANSFDIDGVHPQARKRKRDDTSVELESPATETGKEEYRAPRRVCTFYVMRRPSEVEEKWNWGISVGGVKGRVTAEAKKVA